MDFHHAMSMARVMKSSNDDIVAAINKCREDGYGVVALKFTEKGSQMQIEILDEEHDSNVRVFPGE